MTPELTQLEQLEKLLTERRQYFIATNENAEGNCDDLCFLMTNEKLLAHYDQLIDIVRQAITIGAEISPENRKQFISLFDQANISLEQVKGMAEDENEEDKPEE